MWISSSYCVDMPAVSTHFACIVFMLNGGFRFAIPPQVRQDGAVRGSYLSVE